MVHHAFFLNTKMCTAVHRHGHRINIVRIKKYRIAYLLNVEKKALPYSIRIPGKPDRFMKSDLLDTGLLSELFLNEKGMLSLLC